jgi:hypothetical protein
MKIHQLMLYREIIAVSSEIHTKHKYTVRAERGVVNFGGIYSNHWVFLKGYAIILTL